MCYYDVQTMQTKSTMYKQRKQNLQVGPPKDFEKSKRLSKPFSQFPLFAKKCFNPFHSIPLATLHFVTSQKA